MHCARVFNQDHQNPVQTFTDFYFVPLFAVTQLKRVSLALVVAVVVTY